MEHKDGYTAGRAHSRDQAAYYQARGSSNTVGSVFDIEASE